MSEELFPMNENDLNTCTAAIREVYEQTLLNKAIEEIQKSNPSTGEFVLRELRADYLVVGYLTYHTEEGVCNDFGERMGLTEDDIGEPCEYWEMTLSIEIDGSVSEWFTGNDAVWKHPNWGQIIANSSLKHEPLP